MRLYWTSDKSASGAAKTSRMPVTRTEQPDSWGRHPHRLDRDARTRRCAPSRSPATRRDARPTTLLPCYARAASATTLRGWKPLDVFA